MSFVRIGGLNLFFLVSRRRRRGCARATRRGLHSAAFLRHRRIIPLFASRMMKRKSDPPKARAGLIKSFELKRRKQSENSNRVPAKSPGDGTAVAAGAPANAAELPPACSSAPRGPEARVRGLCERESGSSPCGVFRHESLSLMRDSGSCRPKPQADAPRSDPRDPLPEGRR